ADYKAKVAAALKADPADAEALADQENMAARVAALAKKYDKTDYGKKPKAQKDPYQAEVDKLTTDITANRDLAAAYDLSTAAGFAATAQKAAAVEITRLHATGLDAEKIETLELDDAVTKALDAGAKWIDQAKQKNDISQQVLDIMSQTGESEAVAQKQVADGLELKKAEAVLANASAIDRPRALAQIQEITAAQADSNRIALERQALLDHEAASNQLQTLETELSLLGATNRERTVQLALLKEAQSLRTQGIPLSSAQGVSAVFDTVNTANAQQTLADGFSDPIKQQQYYISLLSEMQTRTSTATADMAASFGTLGKAVGDLTNAYTTYGKTTADIELKRSNDLKAADGDAVKSAIANNQALDSQRLAEAKYYGDALSAASEFFGQKTALFQLAQAAEKAWRLVEFALSVQSMIQRTAEVGVVTATEGAKTAVEVPASLARAAAKGAEGVAGIFAALGPFAFPVAAAAIAMMVAAGVSALGGSGSTVTLPGSTDAATRQAAQGAGTVLGDPAAQSKSIADALTLATANQNTDLQYSSQMVTSLRSIDDNISNFTAAIAKDLGVGGALSTASLNLGTTSSSSLFGLAGSTTTSTLQDQGLQFTPQTIAQIIAQGISGSSYNEVATDKKSSFLGIPTGNKTSLSTTNTALDASLSGDLTRVVASLENGVLSAASTLGITGAKATLDSLVLNLGTVSLKGLTGTALTDAINAVFSKAGDDMAAALLPAISTFQKAGEGAFETLTRLATDYQTVDTTLQSIGKTFTTVGVDSIAARENLVSLVGGVANLVSQTAAFSTAFLTPAQQLAPIQAAVTAEMNRLGLAGITTKDAFAQLVQGIDVSTSAGATLYAALMNVAPAFAKVADAATQAATDATTAANTAAATAVTNAQTDVTNATSALTSAYNTQASAIQSTITTFQGFADSLAAFNNSLSTGPLSGLNAQQQYSATQAAFQKTIATGDYGNVQTTGQAFLAAAQAIAPDAVAYAKDLAAVRIGVQAAQKAATAQVQFAEEQLAELQTQVGSLIDVNNSVLSVADAVRNLQAALGEQTSALVNQAILGSQQRIADNTAAVAANAATAAALAAAASTAPPAPVAPTDPAANDNTTPAAIAATVQAQISAALGGAGGLSGFGSNVQAFATGGSFTVGGSGAQDSKQFSMALSPGEAVNVSRPGEQAALVKELQALRAEVAGMRQEQQAGQIAIATNTGKMAKILQRVTPDGNSLSTAAA
ncbi:MAG TPA: hypothetical protein VFE10_15925, partial [Phenylobacterium sp.]|nr:hypothetical protein [Phenylobacterium sp.]